ncbi:MAG: hypothetical protein JWM81_813 [Candidatus Saccharibacteria bacterium]|nr:hypothetical protein [Candidatus Saccharibacteria bacterium]
MNSRAIRQFGAIAILVASVGVSLYFFKTHPAIWQELKKTPLSTLATVLGLYLVFIATLGFVFKATIMMCRTTIGNGEMLLLTAYSSIINFFGPLQSGPAFRALYLKKKHDINLKHFALASLLNYALYAIFSGLFLISGFIGWWALPLGALALGALYYLPKLPFKQAQRFQALDLTAISYMSLAVLAQVTVMAVIFYVELHSIDPTVGVGQAIIYTGAANFALFVSITPGAIGFRESFVFLAHRLHGIDNATVVASSLIDRGVYVAMLLGLIVIIFFSRSGKSLRSLRKTDTPPTANSQ